MEVKWMKINWKVRFRSYKFWVALLAFAGLIITDTGIMDASMYEKYVQAFLFVLVAGGIVTDMTTAGISDSQKAMTYEKPREDK